MAAVIGLLDILLCDECLSSEQVNMVSQIRRCSTALLRLLNNILDISKVPFWTFDMALAPKCRYRGEWIRILLSVLVSSFGQWWTLFVSSHIICRFHWNQVESGKLLLETADFDLNRELEGLVDMFSVQCVDHDIEIVLDLAGRLFRISFVKCCCQASGAKINISMWL